MKILIIGGGNMGMTYANSFIHSHIVNHEQLYILEKSPKNAALLRTKNIGTVFGTSGPFIKEADLIILAVKPQDITSLFNSIKPYIDNQQVILSIMAGVTINTISKALGNKKVIRAMPNLPAQIGLGMTIFTSAAEVTRIELVTVQNLLNATGKTIYVEQEKMINASTAISGSGPAYVFYFMQSMIKSAIEMGFTLSESEIMTYQTFKGAIDLFNKFDFNCDEWINKVASKGGTTEAALSSFENHQIEKLMNLGFHAALKRANELG